METAPLKSFATWARTALIREVTGRIAAVLAPGSSERVEQGIAVTALEKAIADAGGGDKGRAGVADKVAYTWFNRIMAMRFMDANGYTGIGVVSPQVGVEVGQPEILAEAKRGVIDFEVVSQNTRTMVARLLDGTRASGDPQGEAYALLLADYCRHWNRAMPYMFEREGDYTELLIPANLLADDSVLNRSVMVLTETVCKDVEVIGWLYQFYISERKNEVFAGFKKNKKAGADEIPAATQLFTPHWIVRYLVENSLGRLWMLNRPSSGLVSQMEYYIAPVDEVADFLRLTNPEELKVIDPACGSGHMLTYSFDLLYAIYEEEGYSPAEIPALILTKNLYGTEIDPRAGALAAFALTMKARAKQRTFFGKQSEPNICVIKPISFSLDEVDSLLTEGGDRHAESRFWNQFADADTLGSLIRPDGDVTHQLALHVESLDHAGDMLKADTVVRAAQVVTQAEYLASQYAVVVANPPYMGNKQMDDKLRSWALRNAEPAKHDLYALFLFRAQTWVHRGGCVAMVTPHSWMFLSRYEKFRRGVLSTYSVSSLIHLGARAFETISGEVVQVAAFSLAAGGSRAIRGIYIRLTDIDSASGKVDELRRVVEGHDQRRSYSVAESRFADLPGSPLAYWVPDYLAAAFAHETSLDTLAPARKGMVTARNDVFLRLWHEVSADNCGFALYPDRDAARASGKRWFGYIKGGPARKWWGNFDYVVDWRDDGHRLQTERHPTEDRVWATNFNLEFIFRPNVNWGDVGGSSFAARLSTGGELFDGTGSACFPEPGREYEVLALLNSSSSRALLEILNPTMHFLAGDIARIPFSGKGDFSAPREFASRAVELARLDWDLYETSWDFDGNPLVNGTGNGRVQSLVSEHLHQHALWVEETEQVERENDNWWLSYYGGSAASHSFERKGATLTEPTDQSVVRDLVSYAVGCIFGRYSLDEPGLILAEQGGTLQNYLTKVPTPLFTPDEDNVIPIVDGDWFEDDIVGRFRQFLRVAFGEQQFEENLRFVTATLGVKDLRDYFVKSFYKDHVQRYKKRPIYWLFSSPNGTFNALIYIHRYSPSTLSTVLNEYLREFQAKLKASLEHAERSNSTKEADQLRKMLLELDEYEHDVLYPLASQNVDIDLDDGVKANYPKFGDALKKIPGLEAIE
jgi:hypothetical protein